MLLEKRAERAYKKLEAMGAPVCHLGEGYGGNALFAISAEYNEDEIWADYYIGCDGGMPGWDCGINPKIEKVLKKYGLYAEWYNPGVLDVSEA